MLPDRIERRVRRTSRCWQWLGETNQHGYGRVKLGDRRFAAHVVVYESERGPVPTGKCLDHLCRNRDCVNPDHLEPVTQRENILRGDGIAAHNARKVECEIHRIPLKQTTAKRPQRRCPQCNREYQSGWMRRARAESYT